MIWLSTGYEVNIFSYDVSKSKLGKIQFSFDVTNMHNITFWLKHHRGTYSAKAVIMYKISKQIYLEKKFSYN